MLNDKGFDFDSTTVEEPKKRKGRGRPSGSNAVSSKQVLAEKLNLIINLIATATGREYNYSADDYKKESDALSTIAKENHIVSKILDFLDPVIFIGGIVDKFQKMPKKERKEKTAKTNKNEVQNISLRDRIMAIKNGDTNVSN